MAENKDAKNEKGKTVVTKNVKSVKAADKGKEAVKPKLWTRIVLFWRSLKSDVKKITWPERKEVIKKTGVVLGLILLVGAVVGLLDVVFGFGINFLGGLM